MNVLANVELDAAVEGLLAVVRRETLILAIALQTYNEVAVLIAAARLRWSLACAQQFAARSHAGLIRARSRLVAADEDARRWLPTGSRRALSPENLQHLLMELREPSLGIRKICADDTLLVGFDLDDLPLSGISLRGSTTAHVSARRSRLDCIDATRAKLTRSQFDAASLRLGILDEAVLEECNLSGANLEGTSWRNAQVSRCTASSAVFLNARLDGARFVDCDLRDAYLQAFPSKISGAEFVRCDLRGTCWHGRDLSGVSFVDCRAHGMHGGVTGLREAVIDGADLSPDGDRSHIGTKEELLAAWYQDPGGVDDSGVAAPEKRSLP